jgi:predicted outer membrane repeat protein
MGSEPRGCEAPGAALRRIGLGTGTYETNLLNLAHGISLVGAGEEETVIAGSLVGLRTGAVVSHVTITAWGWWGAIGVCVVGEAPEISHCTIRGNTMCGWPAFPDGYGSGGVVCSDGAAANLLRCTIVENCSAIGGGGVICFGSSPTIVSCVISRNRAGNWSDGGGVSCEGGSSPILLSCVVAGNSSTDNGGGIYCGGGSSPTLVNCLITGNSASAFPDIGAQGGGLYCEGGSSPALVGCTIAGNLATWGGGMYSTDTDESCPTITNCIVWGNRDPRGSPQLSLILGCEAPIVNYSCIDDEGWEWIDDGRGNIGSNPLFVRPGHWDDNGTPDNLEDDTWVDGDYHLQPGSPCIDTGTSEGAPTIDIEGNGRPCGAGVDIGAYEYQTEECLPETAAFVRGNADAQGSLNISDGIFILNFLFLGGREPPCMDAADTDDSGTLNVTDAVQVFNYLFLGGTAPLAPFPDCGADESADQLTCLSYPPCE